MKVLFLTGKKERETEIFVFSSRWFTIKGSYLLKVKGESMLVALRVRYTDKCTESRACIDKCRELVEQ